MFKKKVLPIIIFILSFLGMIYFPKIPMIIFRFNIDNFKQSTKIIYELSCDIGFMIIMFVLYRRVLIKNFKDFFSKFSSNFEVAFKYYFIGVIIMIISNLVIAFCFKNATAGNEDAVRELINKYPLYMIFSVSIYAPFIEELLFRQQIKDIILAFKDTKITKYIYIITSGFVFASLHIIGMATSPVDYIYIIPYLSLGIAFAALCYKKDNVVYSMSMHFLHNTVTIILYLIGVVAK